MFAVSTQFDEEYNGRCPAIRPTPPFPSRPLPSPPANNLQYTIQEVGTWPGKGRASPGKTLSKQTDIAEFLIWQHVPPSLPHPAEHWFPHPETPDCSSRIVSWPCTSPSLWARSERTSSPPLPSLPHGRHLGSHGSQSTFSTCFSVCSVCRSGACLYRSRAPAPSLSIAMKIAAIVLSIYSLAIGDLQ